MMALQVFSGQSIDNLTISLTIAMVSKTGKPYHSLCFGVGSVGWLSRKNDWLGLAHAMRNLVAFG
jgi:hypothetical protein